jgi:hypothetical protein
VSNRERIALQERDTAEQKGKHQNRTERIGWRLNRESDVYISNRDKGSRNRTRQRDRETRKAWKQEREATLKQESENKNEGWADRCFVWEERERWKRTLFDSQAYPAIRSREKRAGEKLSVWRREHKVQDWFG